MVIENAIGQLKGKEGDYKNDCTLMWRMYTVQYIFYELLSVSRTLESGRDKRTSAMCTVPTLIPDCLFYVA